MDDEIRKAFEDINKKISTSTDLLIKNTNYLLKLDDGVSEAFIGLDKKITIIDERLDRIEDNLKMARRDIQTLPDIVSTLMHDGREIAEIKAKVKKLEN